MRGSALARIAVGLLLGVALVLGIQQAFPSEERRIKRQLTTMADDANSLTADLSGAATAARLSMYFTEDVTIDPGSGMPPVSGRQTILGMARIVPARGQTEVSVKDVDVTIAPEGTSAAVTVTVTLTRDQGTGRETLDAREFALTMVKRDSAWLISHVTAVDTLR